jgi:hypothetical protein
VQCSVLGQVLGEVADLLKSLTGVVQGAITVHVEEEVHV